MNRTGQFGSVGVWALCLVSTITWLSMVGLPYEVAQLQNEYQLGSTMSGAVASLELIALAAMVALGSAPLARRDAQRVVVVGVLMAAVATVVSIFASSLPILLISRLVFGAGLGLITISCNALPAAHARPERLFAFMQLTVGVLFVALMYGQPLIDAIVPRSGLFVTQLICLAVFGPFAFLLPRFQGTTTGPVATKAKIRFPLVLALGSCVTLCIALGGAWGFTDQAGVRLQLTPDSITWALTGSALFNNIGPFAAAALGLRLGYAWPLGFGCFAIGVCALLIYSVGTPPAYIAGILALNAVGSFLNPYMLGLLAEHDETGVSSSLGAAALNFGLGAGPLIGGLVVSLGQAEFGAALVVFSVTSATCVLGAVYLLKQGHRLLGNQSPVTDQSSEPLEEPAA